MFIYSMDLFRPDPTVLRRLSDGLDRRIALDTQFQLDLFNRILQLLRELQQCPGAIGALPPGTAGQLTITEADLAGFIRRLETPDNMGRDAIEDIVDPLYNIGRDGDNTLRRTAPGGLPESASGVLPRSRRNPPREAPGAPASRFGFSSLFGSPASSRLPASSGLSEEPGSWSPTPDRPPAPGSPAASRFGLPSWLGSRKAPAQPVRSPDLAESELDNVHDLSGLPGEHASGLPKPGSRFGNSSLGGRKTRRVRKYRNRT